MLPAGKKFNHSKRKLDWIFSGQIYPKCKVQLIEITEQAGLMSMIVIRVSAVMIP